MRRSPTALLLPRRALLGALATPWLARCQPAPAALAAPPREAPRPAASASPPAPLAPAAPALAVDVWHDLVCPWCRIGLHNLHAALAQLGPAARDVRVRYRPYLLDPDTPDEGVDLRARLAQRYGAARLDEMFARVSAAGAPHGVSFAWERVRVAPATTRAHALLEGAPAAQQRALLEALHAAYFERGDNLGERAVREAAARAAGLDAALVTASEDPGALSAVRRGADEARARGIDGVPHFSIGAQTLHGAQPPDALARALTDALRA